MSKGWATHARAHVQPSLYSLLVFWYSLGVSVIQNLPTFCNTVKGNQRSPFTRRRTRPNLQIVFRIRLQRGLITPHGFPPVATVDCWLTEQHGSRQTRNLPMGGELILHEIDRLMHSLHPLHCGNFPVISTYLCTISTSPLQHLTPVNPLQKTQKERNFFSFAPLLKAC